MRKEFVKGPGTENLDIILITATGLPTMQAKQIILYTDSVMANALRCVNNSIWILFIKLQFPLVRHDSICNQTDSLLTSCYQP